MEALVYKSTGSWYLVKDKKGEEFKARVKGKFKIDDITSTNPIAVGDMVDIDKEEGEESIVITTIHDRKNYITRQSPHNKHIHRFLVASEAYHVPAIIVFNKSDLYKSKEEEKFQHIQSVYENVGYPVYSMSIGKNTGVY